MAATTESDWVTEVLSWHKPIITPPFMFMAPENMRLADRAPENMRLADRGDPIFEPILVSIGPFHYGKLPAMDEHKSRILSSMLDRCGNVDGRNLLTKLAKDLREHQEIARECYSKSFPDIDFVKMMILDGCFILEILRMHAGLHANVGDDPIFKARWMLPALALDMVKLENQLPYFVLNMLYERTKLMKEPTLKDLVENFLAILCPGVEVGQSEYHLLSLFHSGFAPNNPPVNAEENRLEGNRLSSFPSVTDLWLSGIKVVKKNHGRNLLEIEYNNGKLEIPTLVIDHNTKILMRNLVAYEQCDKTVPDIFTSYVTFMDALVNSAEDVEVLRVAGVINHFMRNNEEVSIVLNNLTANIKCDMNQGYLADLNAQIYNANHMALARPTVRLRRFVHSREGMRQLITMFGAYLSIFQTFFPVLDYVRPKQS